MATPSPTNACPPDAAFVQLMEGRLPAPAAASLERHVAGCSACRTLFDELARGQTEPAGATAILGDRLGRALLDDALAPGETVGGKYRVAHLLGAGGMGAVYKASHVETGDTVAVKVVKARLLAHGTDGPSRFRREARAASAVDSPYIVRVLDAGEDEVTGNLYLVMEHLDGEDLQKLIDRVGPLPPEVVVRTAIQALSGLREAHLAGIVHRDIKPANLFLARSAGGDVTVKLLDFGVAKITGDAPHLPHATALTTTGGLLGSPLYMSPEQVQNSKDVDLRTDLWSLGSTLYSALTGMAPHAQLESVGKLIVAICSAPARPIREVAPWVPPDLARIVERALAIERDERWPTATAMLEALQALAPEGSTLREDVLVGVTPEERASRPRVRSWRAPRALALAAGALLAATALGYGFVRAKDRAVATNGAATPTSAASASASPPPQSDAPPPAPPTAAPSADVVRRAMLVILPEDAKVEIDGAPATPRGGVVELVGAVGGEHRVRVSKGERSATTTVVLTADGPQPPKVEVPPRPLASAKPSAGGSAPPPPKTVAQEDEVMRRPE
jgi:serine/threonine-protein kinase